VLPVCPFFHCQAHMHLSVHQTQFIYILIRSTNAKKVFMLKRMWAYGRRVRKWRHWKPLYQTVAWSEHDNTRKASPDENEGELHISPVHYIFHYVFWQSNNMHFLNFTKRRLEYFEKLLAVFNKDKIRQNPSTKLPLYLKPEQSQVEFSFVFSRRMLRNWNYVNL